MENDVLRLIDGVAIYPIISLVTFVLVFGSALLWTASLDRTRLTDLSRMPLDDETPTGTTASGQAPAAKGAHS